MDRRTRPARIAEVLGAIDADVVALQEVVGAGPGVSHIEEIGALLGMGWVMGATRQLRGHQYGNAVLSRFPIAEHSLHDLTYKACEERGVQRAFGPRDTVMQLINGSGRAAAPAAAASAQ